jgi:ElaA protein
MAKALDWQFKTFAALSLQELYALLQLRSQVFVVEQQCIYQDMDSGDLHAMHLLGRSEGKLLACARCFAPGVLFEQGAQYSEASIGRVVTHSSLRGQGAGHALMREAIAQMQSLWGTHNIRISAQAHLKDFYHQHGFAVVGAAYDEDGIPHLPMVRS